jgi:16S rRNA (cytidine1402-2'-O)-methyltransferase
MSKLYIIATPIGNLKDITLRALEILREVDIVLAEDKRVTQKLLKEYDIHVPELQTFNHHTKDFERIVMLLKEGKTIGLVSDAGTPGINDPGGLLVQAILASGVDVEIIPIPGVSAPSALASVSGVAMENFSYKGFVPHKKGKQTYLEEVAEARYPVIFLESTHRIIKTLEMLQAMSPSKQLIIGRELTKLHETIYRGTAQEVLEKLRDTSTKGEFTLLAYNE